ncbi:hypothetical protein OROMI_018611 [Orobanche minor]
MSMGIEALFLLIHRQSTLALHQVSEISQNTPAMESTNKSQLSNLNVALLPPPVFLGHLIPFIELAKNLVSHHNCTVTLISDDGESQDLLSKAFRPKSPQFSSFRCHQTICQRARAPRSCSRLLPALRETLLRLSAAALIADLFCASATDVARELGISAYIFYVIAANELSLVWTCWSWTNPALPAASSKTLCSPATLF